MDDVADAIETGVCCVTARWRINDINAAASGIADASKTRCVFTTSLAGKRSIGNGGHDIADAGEVI